ncbi:MAG: hypothetical protein P8K81_01040 [Flavobacteriales bacterium]|nr:hypothetical protein [Flavobacteriales bacterium]
MNDFEKQFQGKLGQEHNPLSGQEQDVLWDSIASQLDADDLRTNHMRLRRRIAGSIAAAGILAALGWSLYPTAESPIVAKEVQKQTQASEALSTPLPQSTATVGATPALAANSESNLDAAAKDTKRSAAAEPPAIVVHNRLAVNAPLASSQDLTTAPSETKIERASALTAMDLLLFMDLKNPPESRPHLAAELVPMATSTDGQSSENDGANRSFNLHMYQGPTWSKFSYLEQDGTNLLAQNDNMKSDGAWSVGAMIEFDALRQRWGVGIEWNEFVHQLNYRGTFEQFTTIDDALLQVEVDPNTGDTLNSVYGAAEVLVVAQRRVVHHNRLRTITIPLEWQNQWSLTPILHGGIALGALVHWRTSLSGRTFTGQEGNIVNYSDSEFPSNRIAVAPMFRMHATYDIAPDWSIELSARMASMKHGSRPSAELPDQSGQFKGRLLTGNLSFGVARAIR